MYRVGRRRRNVRSEPREYKVGKKPRESSGNRFLEGVEDVAKAKIANATLSVTVAVVRFQRNNRARLQPI